MNFLYRSSQPVAPEVYTVSEMVKPVQKPATTLEGLIAEDPYPSLSSAGEDGDMDGDGDEVDLGSRNDVPVGDHADVAEDEGWITIPSKALPDDWPNAANILQLQSLDRSFIFPGEHIHILVCLSASKQVTEFITPFQVAAVMSSSGWSNPNRKQYVENSGTEFSSPCNNGNANGTHEETSEENRENNSVSASTANELSHKDDIFATESLLRMEYHKQRTENILERFRNSNFFVRIAESDEKLWSKRKAASLMNSEMAQGRIHTNGGASMVSRSNHISAITDKGSFDGNMSSGMARDTVRCYSLCNGDIVVLLQVNVGIGNLRDPVLEVLQFEKYQSANPVTLNTTNSVVTNYDDPCGELLNWLLPLDRTFPTPHMVSPPLSSSISQRSTYSASGSQIFSFGHFRSNSMPSFPRATGPPSVASFSNSKPVFDLEDCDRFSSEKVEKNQVAGNEGLLSFRGVPLEPERFSVHCGLEGIYLPGRSWRRKLEIVQPVEIHSFAAECITEDLLCVQIKNVSPSHLPDIIIFLDAITIVYEEASKGSPPLSLPIASIETGTGYSLPDLALRRGEEHSFILKLATTQSKDQKGNGETVQHLKTGPDASNMQKMLRVSEWRKVSAADHFAVLVSCRCNYTESKLFFKQPTDWQPRIARDLKISVASESYQENVGPNARVPQLPVQVLTLKATNLTSEDLTLTVLAPETSTSSPTVLSLSSTPTTQMNSFADSNEHAASLGGVMIGTSFQRFNPMPSTTKYQKDGYDGLQGSNSVEQRNAVVSDVISSNNSGFTHLWLQSTVPLGCIPAHSSASVKLELLPLTDGIITLDTLQIAVKEKGLAYIPEQSLKIYATSSISTGIL